MDWFDIRFTSWWRRRRTNWSNWTYFIQYTDHHLLVEGTQYGCGHSFICPRLPPPTRWILLPDLALRKALVPMMPVILFATSTFFNYDIDIFIYFNYNKMWSFSSNFTELLRETQYRCTNWCYVKWGSN